MLIVDNDDDGKNGTKRFGLERAFQCWSYCCLLWSIVNYSGYTVGGHLDTAVDVAEAEPSWSLSRPVFNRVDCQKIMVKSG